MKRKRGRLPRRPPHTFYSGDPTSSPRAAPAQDDAQAALISVLLARLAEGLDAHPRDTGSLLRSAEALSRIAAAENRLTPKSDKQSAERFLEALAAMEDQLLPPDSVHRTGWPLPASDK
jgi:hypothetical protein